MRTAASGGLHRWSLPLSTDVFTWFALAVVNLLVGHVYNNDRDSLHKYHDHVQHGVLASKKTHLEGRAVYQEALSW